MSKDLCPRYSETFREAGGGLCFVANAERKQAGQQKAWVCLRPSEEEEAEEEEVSLLRHLSTASKSAPVRWTPQHQSASRVLADTHEHERREIKPATT